MVTEKKYNIIDCEYPSGLSDTLKWYMIISVEESYNHYQGIHGKAYETECSEDEAVRRAEKMIEEDRQTGRYASVFLLSHEECSVC